MESKRILLSTKVPDIDEKKRQHTFLFRLDNLEQEAKMLWQNMNVDDRIRVCVCVLRVSGQQQSNDIIQ